MWWKHPDFQVDLHQPKLWLGLVQQLLQGMGLPELQPLRQPL